MSVQEVKSELDKVYAESAPNFDFVKRYHREFRLGRVTVYDEPRSGRPQEVSILDICPQVTKAISADRRISIKILARSFNVSIGTMHSILHDSLGLKKLTTRWVPHTLRPYEKVQRSDLCKQTAVIREVGWHLLDHPPYSPDISPSDYFLFSNLKRWLRGRQFADFSELTYEIERFFDEKPDEWYFEGISSLSYRWRRVIDARDDYI